MIQGVFYNDHSFIRFYKNGTFISCLIRTNNPGEKTFRQILEWFEIGHPSVSQERYSCKGSSIEFKKKTPFGDRLIDYKGVVKINQINFETLNHNTGRRAKETYKKVNIKYRPDKNKRK